MDFLINIMRLVRFNGSLPVYKEKPNKLSERIMIITKDTVLSEDSHDTQFIVKGNATLNLGGFTVFGSTSQGKGSFTPIKLMDSATVSNGTVKNGRTGVLMTPSNTAPNDWKEVMSTLNKRDRVPYAQEIEGMVNTSQSVRNVKFIDNRVHVYVGSFNQKALVSGCEFTQGRLGIYLDSYSSRATITNCKFNHTGRNYFRQKFYVWYPSGREAIAIDGSSDNKVLNSYFTGVKGTAISLYVNCGEKGTPREYPSANNLIKNNSFLMLRTAVHIASRRFNRKTYPCRPDDNGDIVIGTKLEENKFSEVKHEKLDCS